MMSLYVSVDLLVLCVTRYRIMSQRRQENSATAQPSSLEGIPSTEKGSQMYLSVQTVHKQRKCGQPGYAAVVTYTSISLQLRVTLLPDYVREGRK